MAFLFWTFSDPISCSFLICQALAFRTAKHLGGAGSVIITQLDVAVERKKNAGRRNAPKRPYDSGPWALAPPQPQSQSSKSFLLLFFKKEALPSMKITAFTDHAFLPRVAWRFFLQHFMLAGVEFGDPAAAVGQAGGDDMGDVFLAALQPAFDDQQ